MQKESFQRQIKIYYCGREVCASSHAYGPSIRTQYLMHFVIKGKGKYSVGGKTYYLQKNQAFLIRPYESTFYCADEEDPWEYVWIAFDGGDTEQLLAQNQLSADHLVCNITENLYLDKIVESFYKPSSFGIVKKQREILGYFYLVFSCIHTEEEKVQVTGEYDIHYLKHAKEYITNNYSYDIQVQDIARDVGIDRTYLYKIFIKFEKQSPKQYLTNYRLRAAKEMLQATDYKMIEVALSSGFNDASIFCKNFLKAEQMTPTQFRVLYKE